MGHVGRADGPRVLEFVERCRSREQPLTVAEQDGGDSYVHLVDEIRREILLRGARTSGGRDGLSIRGAARLVERRLDSIGDESESIAALELERLALEVRQHEHRV